MQDQLDSEQRQMADEVGAAQSAARADALRREDEVREARARAADLDSVLMQERADAQRQRDEHEHQVRAARAPPCALLCCLWRRPFDLSALVCVDRAP